MEGGDDWLEDSRIGLDRRFFLANWGIVEARGRHEVWKTGDASHIAWPYCLARHSTANRMDVARGREFENLSS